MLLEREREISALLAAADDTAAGTARLAVVEGPAGIGKSRLPAALRSEGAVRRPRVLAARGSELELEFSLGVVRQLFEPAPADPAVRERWLAGTAAPGAAVFSPPREDEGNGHDASFAALHGLFWLTADAAADEPLLLSVDDLHRVDGPSPRLHRLPGAAAGGPAGAAGPGAALGRAGGRSRPRRRARAGAEHAAGAPGPAERRGPTGGGTATCWRSPLC